MTRQMSGCMRVSAVCVCGYRSGHGRSSLVVARRANKRSHNVVAFKNLAAAGLCEVQPDSTERVKINLALNNNMCYVYAYTWL